MAVIQYSQFGKKKMGKTRRKKRGGGLRIVRDYHFSSLKLNVER